MNGRKAKELRRKGMGNEKFPGGPHLIGQPKMIVGNDKLRAQMCLAKIQQVLQEFDCQMEPEITIGIGQVRGNLKVVPIPRGLKQ